MNEIIKRFEQQCPNGGLCIIGTPTGFGKTYNAGKYIAEHFNDGGVFFYITHLKKNINGAIKECRKHFVETYGEDKGAELFLNLVTNLIAFKKTETLHSKNELNSLIIPRKNQIVLIVLFIMH